MDKQIEDCLERLCQKGCMAVRSDILSLEKGESLPETEGLNQQALRVLLKELKSVMAAYGDTCRV